MRNVTSQSGECRRLSSGRSGAILGCFLYNRRFDRVDLIENIYCFRHHRSQTCCKVQTPDPKTGEYPVAAHLRSQTCCSIVPNDSCRAKMGSQGIHKSLRATETTSINIGGGGSEWPTSFLCYTKAAGSTLACAIHLGPPSQLSITGRLMGRQCILA